MYQTMMIPEFEQLIKKKNVNILDVREEDEFQSGHIDGAVNIPLSVFSETAERLEKDKDYYVICHSGSRSQLACQLLGSKGFTTTNIMGGMSAWRGDIV
ncbi:rhodanese-like domain-containing protein [Enterococcus sp. BWT-B8]|uniref:rhodanese-like domain-containing protein n=1 Tax=Enterococcus sp. BWT-B8 TaxID=2885157 RepID=UPI001E456073|nr:rhodanese-like domain-containing protein [Enterococcus sp. BWT-B8]MCB5953086.1 rhodanese-like domain-containing protein [Enterococcus sp. BWT-B8]